MKDLPEIADAMLYKGLLAMDESIPTCNKRFSALNIPPTEEKRKNYREILITTPHLADCISGAILSNETIHQKHADGKPFIDTLIEAGILPGVKVDKGAKELAGFPHEKVTEGLDDLRPRLEEYKALGARFAKWRAVILISESTPSSTCIEANAHALARYAALCQEAGLVPIVEPEVLMDGNHSLETCCRVTEKVHKSLFQQLYQQRVMLEGIVLKPNMILPGKESADQPTDDTIATATISCFKRSVPAAVPGVAFLSGGQPSEKATSRLNAMHQECHQPLPWDVTFSFSRAIEYPAMEIWNGKKENTEATQRALYHRAKCDLAARKGEYTPQMEKVEKGG